MSSAASNLSRESIPPTPNKELRSRILARLNDLTKPPGSLGRLEAFVVTYCLCRGNADADLKRMEIYTFAGDHGITAEKITPFPPEVTPQMVLNMAHGGAAISVMCAGAGIRSLVVDVGVNSEFADAPSLIRRKVCRGTRNFAHGPAMTPSECHQAMDVGIVLARESSADLLGIGEMGIGNTASASALYSMILDIDTARTVGSGTGATGELLEHKRRVVSAAVELHRAQWDSTPEDALRRVGGLEIAGMCGMVLGAAARRIPVVVDGFISSAAALVAMRIMPSVRDYLFWSHASAESFHAEFLRHEGIRPMLDLDMRLGEGTGAALAMQIIAQAMRCYHGMATFSSAGVAGGR